MQRLCRIIYAVRSRVIIIFFLNFVVAAFISLIAYRLPLFVWKLKILFINMLARQQFNKSHVKAIHIHTCSSKQRLHQHIYLRTMEMNLRNSLQYCL